MNDADREAWIHLLLKKKPLTERDWDLFQEGLRHKEWLNRRVSCSESLVRQTPLMWMIHQKNQEGVKALIQAGADVNLVADETELTGLFLAVYEGMEEVVELLLEAGADVNKKNANQDTVLMCAVRAGHLHIVDQLLKKGARVNEVNALGESALMQTLNLEQDTEIRTEWLVKKLLQYGANVNLVCQGGMTPLMEAVFWIRSKRIIQVLIDAGADASYSNPLSKENTVIRAVSASIYAKRMHQDFSEVVDLLIQHGASVNFQDQSGNTALELAALTGQLKTVQVLLRHGAHPNHQNEKGNTALRSAVMIQHFEIIECLLRAGGDVFLKNKKNQSVWDWSGSDVKLQRVHDYLKAYHSEKELNQIISTSPERAKDLNGKPSVRL